MAICLRLTGIRAYLIFVSMLMVFACKKEAHSPAERYYGFDKGIVFQEDFEPLMIDWQYYNTDTVSTSVVKLIALDSTALSYQWTIEAATYNTREVRLRFPPDYSLTNRKLTIKLLIRYRTISNTDTVKSFEKVLTFFNPCVSKFNGIFKGTTDNGRHTDSFKIGTCTSGILHTGSNFYLENFQLQCGRYFDEQPDSYNIGYKQILFSATGEFLCNSPSGIITLYGDSICMRYRSFENGMLESPLDHVFRGFKN